MLRVDAVTKVYEPPSSLARLLIRTAHHAPVVALHGTTFAVEHGEVVGLVGPNGAGKSTLLRICATLLEPTSGSVTLDGVDVLRDSFAARRSLGLQLTDDRGMYDRLTGRQNIRFFGVMNGLSQREAARRADELLEEFGLASRDRRVFGYSTGMKATLALARALIASPPLLILDEPSRSLDPIASQAMVARLSMLASQGHAVLLSSHRLNEVEQLCDRILVIDGGRQVAWCVADELPGNKAVAERLIALLRGETQQ